MFTDERTKNEDKMTGSSNLSFGLVFAGLFALLALREWWSGWFTLGYLYLGQAAIFAALALVYPVMLAPLNRFWTKFGFLISRLMSPLVLAMIFFVVVTPIGLLMRLLGKDMLRLKRAPRARSYWIERDPPGPSPYTIKNQF